MHSSSQPTRRFDHHRLDAFVVAQQALVAGHAVARRLPRGYGKLKDQLERALQGAYLQVAEAAGRSGADRRSRLRTARAEAGEAAAALEALVLLRAADASESEQVIELLWRLCAMLTRLGRLAS